ncbi:MAG TPA: hypothetical protein VHR41_01945 [Gemmatimonadales bacterium]|nr:hypothetical protein [Gemmatimonadales bacterium]
MIKLLGWMGATLGGAAGWWVGDRVSLFSAFVLSVVGTGAGLYLGRRLADALVE